MTTIKQDRRIRSNFIISVGKWVLIGAIALTSVCRLFAQYRRLPVRSVAHVAIFAVFSLFVFGVVSYSAPIKHSQRISIPLRFQQQLARHRVFEAVSVKISEPPFDIVYMHSDPRRIDYRNVTLQECIMKAYGLIPEQILGPSWLSQNRYIISAVADSDATEAELMSMLALILEDRFRLSIHREQKVLSSYVLTVGEHGPKLEPSKGDGPLMIRPTPDPGLSFAFTHATMDDFVSKFLGARQIHLDRPVTNATGLTGSFDFVLKWEGTEQGLIPESSGPDSLPSPIAPGGPSLADALQSQLGLKLVNQRSTQDVLVIDHAEQVPSPN